jgi:hypothetical protein
MAHQRLPECPEKSKRDLRERAERGYCELCHERNAHLSRRAIYAKRKALNEFIRSRGLFDGVADFDAATIDPETGGMRAELIPESTTGGPGDKLHPNRVGYLAMGMASI